MFIWYNYSNNGNKLIETDDCKKKMKAVISDRSKFDKLDISILFLKWLNHSMKKIVLLKANILKFGFQDQNQAFSTNKVKSINQWKII